MNHHPDRRRFLRNAICAALGGAGLYSALGQLRLVEATTLGYGPGAFNDYKALVCVFLFGGNDAMNMLVPRDAVHHQQYAQARPTLAIPRASLLPLTPQAGGAPSDGAEYGLQASTSGSDSVGMGGLQGLFNQGRAAILGNVGTLIAPVTRAQYQNGSVPVPPQLFSHNDQQNYWQVSRSDERSLGWGGRIADLLQSASPGASLPMTIAIGAESEFERAAGVSQYVVGSEGPRGYRYLDARTARRDATLALMQQGMQTHALERSYAASFNRSRANAAALTQALQGAPALTTPFPTGGLSAQLRMVARLIGARAALGLKRQIFFVSLGGFDHHDDLLGGQPALLAQLSQAMTAFHQATVELGVAESVTAFTASDFGRTLSSNGDGTDHGWGGHHFIVGGAVRGGRYYGRMPTLQNGGPDDAGWGQIIPTTSVDQYAATLARWFGVAEGDLDLILPNLGNFPTRNLGFMT